MSRKPRKQYSPHDVGDQVVDYVDYWSEQAELPAQRLLRWLGVREGKFYAWRQRYGKLNAHDGRMPQGDNPIFARLRIRTVPKSCRSGSCRLCGLMVL